MKNSNRPRFANSCPWRLVGAAVLIGLVSQPVLAQEDFLFGTWTLNPGLSVYLDQQPPKSQVRIYKPHPDGIEAMITTVEANGMEVISSYVAEHDGVPHPVYGLANSDSVILEKLDPLTTLLSFTHAGITTATAERNISQSGTEMTITVKMEDEVISKSVYEKTVP